jgi:hypothetical protein
MAGARRTRFVTAAIALKLEKHSSCGVRADPSGEKK